MSRSGGGALPLVVAVFRGAGEHRLADESAKIAYFFFLSLFPLILILFALAGILGGEAAFAWVMAQLQSIMPSEAASYLGRFVKDVTTVERLDVLSLSVLFLLVAASNSVAAMVSGLGVIFGISDRRPWWRRNLLQVGTTLLGALFLLLGVSWFLAGPKLLQNLGIGWIWIRLHWPIVFAFLAGLVFLAYRFLPNHAERPSKRATLIGAVVGTALWAVVTQGFRFYLARFETVFTLYGFVTGILVMLIWLYLTAFTLLLGAQVTATVSSAAREKR